MTLVTPNGEYRYSPTDHSGLTGDFISVNTVTGGKFVPTPWAKDQLVRLLSSR
jgi:branched-chain amino acid transport system substrate-binding protein